MLETQLLPFPLNILPISGILTAKNYLSYKYYLKKQNRIKGGLESRIRNSLREVRDLRISSPYSAERYEKLRECEVGLYRILQFKPDLWGKSILEKRNLCKATFRTFSELEKYFPIVEKTIDEGASENKLLDYIRALEGLINGAYTYHILEEDNSATRNEEAKKGYLKLVLNDLDKQPPAYGLDGKITKKRYKLKKHPNKVKYKRQPINLECKYCGPLLDCEDIEIEKEKPNVLCYLAEEVTEEAKNLIENFANRTKLLFAYELGEKELYSSAHSVAEVFSRYFHPEKEILTIEQILSNFPAEV